MVLAEIRSKLDVLRTRLALRRYPDRQLRDSWRQLNRTLLMARKDRIKPRSQANIAIAMALILRERQRRVSR